MDETGDMESEEYKVYSDILDQRLGLSNATHEPIVIRDHTVAGIHRIPDDLVRLFEEAAGIQGIRERNQEPHRLENKFIPGDKIILLSNREIAEAGTAPSESWDWDRFRSRYNSAIHELSRVSFDRNHKLAHLYFGVQADYHIGYGCHFILENKQGNWTIRHELPAWKS